MVTTYFFKRLAAAACLTCVIAVPMYSYTPHRFHVEYQSPATGSRYVASATNIILRLSSAIDASGISAGRLFVVEGSRSGRHTGSVKLADDGQTVLFKPHTPFAAGERVSVTVTSPVQGKSGEQVPPFSFSFSTGSPVNSLPK